MEINCYPTFRVNKFQINIGDIGFIQINLTFDSQVQLWNTIWNQSISKQGFFSFLTNQLIWFENMILELEPKESRLKLEFSWFWKKNNPKWHKDLIFKQNVDSYTFYQE